MASSMNRLKVSFVTEVVSSFCMPVTMPSILLESERELILLEIISKWQKVERDHMKRTYGLFCSIEPGYSLCQMERFTVCDLGGTPTPQSKRIEGKTSGSKNDIFEYVHISLGLCVCPQQFGFT